MSNVLMLSVSLYSEFFVFSFLYAEFFIYPKFNKRLALVQTHLLSHLKQNSYFVY